MDSLERFKCLNSIIWQLYGEQMTERKSWQQRDHQVDIIIIQIRDKGGLQEVVKVDVRKWLNT